MELSDFLIMKTKTCSKCGIEKPLYEFDKNKNLLDGYHYECKLCRKSIISQQKYLRKINLRQQELKACSKCKKEKPFSDFSKDKKASDGLSSWCKACYLELYYKNIDVHKNYRIKNKKKIQQYAKERYLKNKERIKLSGRNIRLKCDYGLTLEDYNKMLDEQNGVCAICGQKETGKNCNGEIRQLSVDHNHKTGVIRGLLCNSCNNLLGRAKEDIDVLNKAIKYLKENERCQ